MSCQYLLQGSCPKNGDLISVLLSLVNSKYQYNKTTLTFHFHIFIYSTCNHFTHSGSSNGCQEKMLMQNAERSKNVKLKCCKFSTLQKCETKMKLRCSVLQQQLFHDIRIMLFTSLNRTHQSSARVLFVYVSDSHFYSSSHTNYRFCLIVFL